MAGRKHRAMSGPDLKRRFFASLALSAPVLLLSSPMGLALPVSLSFPGSDWVVAALATALYAAAGRFCAARQTSCADASRR